MSPRRTLTALALSVATVLVSATPAAAARNPYTPGKVCGAGYRVVDQHLLRSAAGTRLGTSYLLYSATTRENCAVLLKSHGLGRPTYTAISLKKRGARAPWVVDFGDFRYFAGPVYVKAPGTCVRFGASLSFPGGRKASWISPFGHCR